ncbi:MAG TPA: peptidoglycan-binding protein [Candidatus Paceibacterota bacterium]
MYHFSRIALFVFVALFTLVPHQTLAQTNAELQTRIQALLTQIAQLQAQLGLPVTTTPATPSTSAPSVPAQASCPQINRILKPGMEGADVSALQRFLTADRSVYPEGLITGYYGSLTVVAVQRWQAKNGIASSGAPDTTGFGQVGPRTAAAMSAACILGGPVASGFMEVHPISGTAPLTVSVKVTVNTLKSCEPSVYSLSWGDAAAAQNITVAAGACDQLQRTYTHLYTYGGTYVVRLASGPHQSTASVVVSGPSAPSTTSALPVDKIDASVTSGAAPLTVRFTGVLTTKNGAWRAGENTFSTLDFGDGTSVRLALPREPNTAQSFTVDHTYVQSGTVRATLYQGPQGSALVGQPISITISAGSASLPAQKFEASPQSGRAPYTVTFTGVVNSDNDAWCSAGCSNTLDFGDNTSVQVPLPANQNSAQSFTVQHTYVAAGTYSARLYQGSAGDALIGSAITISVEASEASLPQQSMSASPQSGTAPLLVRFSGTVTGASKGWCAGGCASTLDYGDGTSAEVPLPPSATGVNTFSVEHTYTTGGTYTATLYQDAKGDGYTPVGSVTVQVAADPVSSYQYGTMEVSVVSGRTISVRFDIPTDCTAYELSWGDGRDTRQQSQSSSCAQFASTKSFSHEYTSGGMYSVTLRRGPSLTRTDTATISVSN